MEKKVIVGFILFVLICLGVTSSVAPTAAGSQSASGTKTVTLKKLDGKTVTKQVQPPQYGGTLNIRFDSQVSGWDVVNMNFSNLKAFSLMMDQLGCGDWTKSPAGTDELPWVATVMVNPELKYAVGSLAASWQQVDPTTISITLRKGIHFWNKEPVNGREMVADDVVYSFKRIMADPKTDKSVVQYISSVAATDNYTVTFKLKEPQVPVLPGLLYGDYLWIIPHEVIDKYGNMNDWHNVVGSGPFMLTNVVEGSQYTLTRNPDYWGKDPYFPENQLPYLDVINIFVIPDLSAAVAALRTGRIDVLSEMAWQDGESLVKSNSELKYVKKTTTFIGPRIDFITEPGNPPKADTTSPFSDIRVRLAMCMAIDRNEIVKNIYKGNGEAYTWPFRLDFSDSACYIPFNKLPASTKKQFTYNVAQAKQLLKEAGYPTGFKSTIQVKDVPGNSQNVELLASYWSKIGVNVELTQLDNTTFNGMRNAKKLKGLVADTYGPTSTLKAIQYFTTGSSFNLGHSDPVLDQLYKDASTTWDPAQATKKWQKAGIQLLDECWAFIFPQPTVYNLWYPKVKNYYGQQALSDGNLSSIFKHVWIQK